jgi:hypothetical protein
MKKFFLFALMFTSQLSFARTVPTEEVGNFLVAIDTAIAHSNLVCVSNLEERVVFPLSGTVEFSKAFAPNVAEITISEDSRTPKITIAVKPEVNDALVEIVLSEDQESITSFNFTIRRAGKSTRTLECK